MSQDVTGWMVSSPATCNSKTISLSQHCHNILTKRAIKSSSKNATSNKCIPPSNKCMATSNKGIAASNKGIATSSNKGVKVTEGESSRGVTHSIQAIPSLFLADIG